MSTSPAPRPVQIVLRDPRLERDRALVFFRLILLIPHFVWLALWGLAIVVLLPILWVAALILGRAPDWMHRFYGAYVRYYVSVYGYGTFLTDTYPPFNGRPGYAVDVEIAPPAQQPRWTILLRLLLVLPPLVLASTLHDSRSSLAVLGVVWLFGWFACMAKGRMPAGMRDLAVYCLGYGAQVWGYLFLLTARYPDSTPALVRPAPQPEHPVRAALDDDLRRSRLTVFFRLLLFLPHLVWLVLWGIAVNVVAIVSWFAALFSGRVPAPLHRFMAAYVRYQSHVIAFVALVANPFPGFVGAPGSYPFDVAIDPPERQNRWITGFRAILAFPASIIGYVLLTGAVYVAAIGAWLFALLTGRMPRGLRDLGAFSIRYLAQLNAYALLLTDRYPYSGPTLETGPAHSSWLPPSPPEEREWSGAPEAVT